MTSQRPAGLNKIIHQTREGDYRLFEKDFLAIFNWLVDMICIRFSTLDVPLAEGIAQIAIIKLLIKGSQYRGNTDREASNWLYAIAHRLALTTVKKENRYLDFLDYGQHISIHGNPADIRIILNKSDRSAIRKKLTDRENEVLALYLKGYKKSEIADELGVARPRITQLMKSIAKKLRDYLGP
jgi:RNA polymerase sigma factor (sigma-70 family)